VNPESRRKHRLLDWIPGSRLTARPGMTAWKFFSHLEPAQPARVIVPGL
jgi:hypothetical protein